ncbi:acetyl-CoA acetyltransferase [Aeromicrobium marinum DSM 15272]|uniref:Acetyl-CoA acetyltransferase n=1 Tax=Aeromicrobium marinum DSM 15272 TaxID=585531 RepID=E2SBY2_9ACTN|nr:crotonase/enoyl-CoA hydratase family protein [Aeromicrobium marinum]EFQ83268.1 acetyl-CoA acetyltransferase [Aeromicrobium marinum DSM 15272]
MTEPLDPSPSHDRTAGATVTLPVPPSVALAVVTDLGSFPAWLDMHSGWRGRAPGRAVVGLQFVEQVQLMGIPAEVQWEVVEVGDDRLGLEGSGPMELTLALLVTLAPQGDGTTLRLDIGLSGDPVRGPMGGSVLQSVQEAVDASVTRLVDHVAGADPTAAGPADGAAPVRHDRTGQLLDPHTPVIVGVGQHANRAVGEELLDPVELSVLALRAAETDSGSSGLLASADAVYAIASASWTYRDQAAAVAAQVGADPAETVMSARFGGDAGALLLNDAGAAIAEGRVAVALVSGAEAGATLAAAQKQGLELDWPRQAEDVAPTRVLGSDRAANTDPETAAGLSVPVYTYALFESALQAAAGHDTAEHEQVVSELWSGLSDVAAANPHAWSPQARSASELLEVGDENRMISSPYRKLMCANLTVDLAAGLIVTSVAAAQAAGVPQDRWVFLHAGASAHDEWFVSERGDLASSPAIRTIGAAALAHAGRSIEQIRHVDLYSCFPSAVQIGARELGLPVGDPARPLSVTGGLTFAGGPGNNYGTHAVASLVPRLRAEPDTFGLSTSVGWFLTKHAVGIFSAQPPVQPYRDLHPVVEATPTRTVLAEYEGEAVVEAHTTQFDRDGSPDAVILSVVTPAGDRVLVRTRQPEVASAGSIAGRRVQVGSTEEVRLLDESTEVPAAPPLPVRTERHGSTLVIVIDRPERRNAVDLRTALLIERAVDLLESDPTLRVGVLTGAGGHFSAGMDLKAAAAGQFPLTDGRGPLGITGRPPTKPLVAAVEGAALAGGCELALAADLIVASSTSVFGLPEPKRGLVAAAGGVMRLTQALPRKLAMEMVLTGDPVPAVRLAELGLVNRVVEPGRALEAALELAASIAVNAPMSVRIGKQIVTESPDWTTDEAFDRQSDLAAPAVFSDDAREGVQAFVEHRDPVWTGH